MNSPLLFIIVPAVSGLALYFLRRWYRLTVAVGVGIALVLAVLAWFIPLGVRINLGVWSFRIAESLDFLGRRLVLADQDRRLLWMVYAMASFWFTAVYLTKAGRALVPLGLLLIAFWVAALAVDPLLYAALLVEMAVLVSIPILIQPGRQGVPINQSSVQSGLRFLIFQTLAMILLLLTGWAITGAETMPNSAMVLRIASLLIFGLALLQGVFPFHSWISMLMERSHPYAASFVLVTFLWMAQLLGLRFLDRYLWLSQVGVIASFFWLAGALILLVGSFSAALDRNLARMAGFALLAETGYGLLAAGYAETRGLILVGMLPRVVSFGVLALTMSIIQARVKILSLQNLRGLGIQTPFLCTAMWLAFLSIAGLPGLAFFPLRIALWNLIPDQAIWLRWTGLAGQFGLLIAATRLALSLVNSNEPRVSIVNEDWRVNLLAGIAILVLFGVGLFPQGFSDIFLQGLRAFPNLIP